MRFMRFTTPVLAALISTTALAAGPAANSPAWSLWTNKLQQKVCSKLEWTQIDGVNVLRVWNTDTTVLQFRAAPSGALTPGQALMSAACSPNAKVANGHTYWVKVNNPTLALPNATRIVVTYPPAPVDTKPVFNPPKTAWYFGMQDKTCSAIELLAGAGFAGQDSVLLHNTDDTVVSLVGADHAVSPLQQEAIYACGPNSAFADASHTYRVSVKNPNATIATPTRIVFTVPQSDASN